jgi:hypothetical protein
MVVGPMPPGKMAAVYERHECVLAEIRRRGVASWDQVYPAVRTACGATRNEVKISIEKLVERGALEVVEKSNRWGKQATFRVKEEG